MKTLLNHLLGGLLAAAILTAPLIIGLLGQHFWGWGGLVGGIVVGIGILGAAMFWADRPTKQERGE